MEHAARTESASPTFDGHAFVTRFNDAWNGHQVEEILSMMTDDVVFEASFGTDPWGTRVTGKAAVRDFLEEMFERIPDVRWHELRHFAHPELVAVEWLTTGTPRSGPPFRVEGCDILRLEGGLISAKRSYRKGQV